MIIKHIDYGIACRINNTIYINKGLKKYKELYKSILEHEKAHTSKFKMKDILLDFELKVPKKEYYQFILANPKALIEYLPFWFYDGQIVYNNIMILFYIILFLSIGVTLQWI